MKKLSGRQTKMLACMISSYMGDSGVSQAAELNFLRHIKASTEGVQSAYTGYANLTSADSQGVTEKEKPAGYDPKTRAWYKAALAADDTVYTPVYKESKTQKLAAGVVKKINRDGQTVGVAGITLDVDAIRQIAEQFRIGETGYAAILDEKGGLIYYPNAELSDNINDIENGALAAYSPTFMSGQKAVQQGKIGSQDFLMEYPNELVFYVPMIWHIESQMVTVHIMVFNGKIETATLANFIISSVFHAWRWGGNTHLAGLQGIGSQI